jgi:hypothetical protein
MAMDSERETDLIERIADELRPYKSGRRISMDLLRTSCRHLGRFYHFHIDNTLTTLRETTGRVARQKLKDVALASRALTNALRQAPKSVTGPPFETEAKKDTFLVELERIANWAAFAAGEVRIWKARNDRPKYICALCAYYLMYKFSNRKVATTPNGGFLEISSLLYELFTGKQDKAFDSACRKIHKKHKNSTFPWRRIAVTTAAGEAL